MQAVQPLRQALGALEVDQWVLTPVHVDFVQVCLAARAYKAAAQVLAT